MSAVALDVAAVRARFSALSNELVFFDGPGGSQVPDEVIDAIADYLRTSNANVSGPYSTSASVWSTSRAAPALTSSVARRKRSSSART